MDILIKYLQEIGSLLFYYVIPFVIVLGFMVFIHEAGHFLIAKYFNVKVLKFALGFGPKIAGRQVGETEYSVRYIPLGGFVKMLGENDNDDEEGSEKISPEDEKRAFNRQPVIKRIAIVAAGPIFNLILALVLFCGSYMISGDEIRTTEVGQVTEGLPAYKAGVKQGDLIMSVDGQIVKGWDDLKSIIQDQVGKPISMTIKRQSETISVTIIPEQTKTQNEFGETIESAQIGIVSAGKYEHVDYNFFQAIDQGFKATWKWIKLTCLVVVKLFEGVVSVKTLGGPLMIGQLTGELVQHNIGYLLPFVAIISINLGILNLFPIPILDGGLIFFLIVELVMGRPLSIKKRELAQKIGFSLLIALMVLVFYNDILRMFQSTQ
jgi:regulator of sigma E protease